MRKANDYYPTPQSFVDALIHNLQWHYTDEEHYWEPCSGDGRIVKALKKSGRNNVIGTDIQNGEEQDFFKYKTALAPNIITNPPFKVIRPFIDHAFEIGVWRMILFCNERLFACKKGYNQFKHHRPSRFINLTWREDYLGKGGSPDRSIAIAIWDCPHSYRTLYEVWNND